MCVSRIIRREISEGGEEDVTFPLSLLSASHEALINLVRLFRDGRKKSGAKEVQEVEGEQRGGGSL